MKLTIFVPIFGYLILFNEQVAQLFEVSAQVVDFSGKSDSLGLEAVSYTHLTLPTICSV